MITMLTTINHIAGEKLLTTFAYRLIQILENKINYSSLHKRQLK